MIKSTSYGTLGIAITGGVLMSASFPPVDLPILQIPGWMLLLWLGDNLPEKKLRFRVGFVYLLIWNLLTTYWLMMATFAGGLAAILANSLLMTLPLLLLWSIQRKDLPVWSKTLLLAGIWTAFEFFHHHWQLSWPWLTLGNAWSVWPSLIQWISVTGHLGISFWIILSSSIFYFGIRQIGKTRSTLLWAILFFGLPSGLWSILDVVRPDSASAVTDEISARKDLEVIIVQPDQNSLLPYGGHGSLNQLILHLESLTEPLVTSSTDVIVWPENAVDGAVQLGTETSQRLQDLSHRWGAEIITGAMLVETYPQLTESLSSADSPPMPKLKRKSTDGTSYNIYNAALHFRNGFSENVHTAPAVYKKANLVPIVERVPYVEILSGLPVISRVDWASLQGYGKGDEATLFHIGNGSVAAPLICYDSVYPDWIRQFVLQGASVLTIITNDGWWGNTSGHTQHFEYARLRAIEFHRPVIRSANNGISGIIMPDGHVLVQTDYATENKFRIRLPVETRMTFFARNGNWIGWISILISLFAVVLTRFKSSI